MEQQSWRVTYDSGRLRKTFLFGAKNSFWVWFRIPSDGAHDGNVFVIPEGQVLVVTDLDWRYETPNAKELDGLQTVRQFGRINLANQSSKNLVGVSQGTVHADPSSPLFLKTGRSYGSIQMTSGFVVHSGASPLALFNIDVGNGARIDIFLRGYFNSGMSPWNKLLKLAQKLQTFESLIRSGQSVLEDQRVTSAL
jgi:hypothetical protein